MGSRILSSAEGAVASCGSSKAWRHDDGVSAPVDASVGPLAVARLEPSTTVDKPAGANSAARWQLVHTEPDTRLERTHTPGM